MNIEKDKVVQFAYRLTDADQNILEDYDASKPMAYLHGHDNMLDKLEGAMNGKSTGDKLQVTLEPEDAYGERREDAQQRVPIKHLLGGKKWRKGMIATVQTEQGKLQVTVLKVGKFMAMLDFNHPYAGKTLTFDMEILGVRDATNEELHHGHAHGAGGHQH